MAAMTAESLLDPRLIPGDVGIDGSYGLQQELPLLQNYLLGENGDWNLTSKALGQRLAELERVSLEDLAQELFAALKLSEGTLMAARARRIPVPGGGSVKPCLGGPEVPGLRRSHSATATQSGSQYSPSLTPRMPASPKGSKKPMNGHASAIVSSSGQRNNRSLGSGSGSISSTRGAAVAASILASGSESNITELDSEVPSTLRSPRQAVSEVERQQIFDRLYNSAKEQRVRRHTLAELKKLQSEVRFVQECPFEPAISSNHRRRKSPPSGQSSNA